MRKINIRSWRIMNTIVFGIGLITPWIRFDLDAQSIPFGSTPGWMFILETWSDIWSDFWINGIGWDMWPFWLFGFSDVLLILYLIRNLYLVTRNVYRKGNKLFTLMLLGVAGALLFDALIGDQPVLGYWLINLGLLSSAVLEWTTAVPDLPKE